MCEISKHNQKAIDNYLTELSSKRKDAGTIRHVNYTLSRLAKFLGDTDFEKATKEQMMKYFDTIKSDSTYNITGSQIKRFLGWLNTPEDKRDEKIETTNNMKWFKYLNEKKRSQKKDPEGIKKYLITPEEYKTILDASKDKYGFYEALWETYRYSGGRLGEVQSMTVGDVKIEIDEFSLPIFSTKNQYVLFLHFYPPNNIFGALGYILFAAITTAIKQEYLRNNDFLKKSMKSF